MHLHWHTFNKKRLNIRRWSSCSIIHGWFNYNIKDNPISHHRCSTLSDLGCNMQVSTDNNTACSTIQVLDDRTQQNKLENKPQKRPNGNYASPLQDLCTHPYKCVMRWMKGEVGPQAEAGLGSAGTATTTPCGTYPPGIKCSRYNGGQASYLCTHPNETSSPPSTTFENLIRLQMPSQEQKTREDVHLPGRLVFFMVTTLPGLCAKHNSLSEYSA